MVGSAALTAAIDTIAELGGVGGGKYSPAGEMVPVCAVPPLTSSTCQLTVWSLEPVTVAVYCDAVPIVTALGPAMDTASAEADEALVAI